jgi:hypothetical protein
VAGWAVGVFNIFFGGVRQGKFFSFTVNHLFDSEIFFQQLAVAEPDSDFHFFSAIGSCWNPIPIFVFPIFSARWQLLNPTPFSFSEPQVAVAETDTVFLLFTEFRNSGSCGCRNRFFFLSKYSAIRLQLVLSES